MSCPATPKNAEEFFQPLWDRLGVKLPVFFPQASAVYVNTVGNSIIEGMGYMLFSIKVKEGWHVASFAFMDPYLNHFGKTLLLKLDKETNRMERCHSFYVDEKDLDKKGGTITSYTIIDILTVLIDHAIKFSEKDCPSCRGENPLQLHYIQLIGEEKKYETSRH